MKKFLSIFVSLVLIIFQIGTIKVSADTIYKSGDYTYSVSNSTAVITGYTGSGGNITIPSKIDGYIVTSIGDSAFIWCSSLTSITIPSSVKSIGNYAFNSCIKLTSITIPNSVTGIGNAAFAYSGLTNITIPSSVTSIGDYAFSGCTGLTIINVDANNISYSSFDGVLYNKAITTLISYPVGTKNSTFVVPSGVTSIGNGSFKGCNSLTGITISNSVTSIGSSSFEGCSSLTSIIIPKSVISIGYKAFFGCSKLTRATIPSSVISIDDSAFFNCPSNLIIYYHNTAIGFTNPWKGYKTVSGNMISYDGNGNTGGIVPIDNNIYIQGAKAIILKNTDNFVRTGYTFVGWNTVADGSGISYTADTTMSMSGADVILYAKWMPISPATGTFKKTAPANLTAVITAPNKATNPVVGVYNGDTKLVGGTDEAVTPTATGYILTLYKSYLSKLTSNTTITVKFKDNSIVTYTVVLGATISPATETFTKTAPADFTADLTAVITAPNKVLNPVVGVYNGTTRLVAGTDQSIVSTATGYLFTIYSTYLYKLTSNTPITIKFKDGSSLTYTVVLGATISPATGTFTKTAPTNLTAVITAPNKVANPVTGVYNGTTRLIAGTDQAIVPTTTGYNFTLYKSYLSKLTSNTVITLKFKDGSSINFNVNVR